MHTQIHVRARPRALFNTQISPFMVGLFGQHKDYRYHDFSIAARST
jgi:hypothetical protein